MRPARIFGDIGNDDARFRKRRGAARAHTRANRPRCESRGNRRREVRAGNGQQLIAALIHQENKRSCRSVFVDGSTQFVQNARRGLRRRQSTQAFAFPQRAATPSACSLRHQFPSRTTAPRRRFRRAVVRAGARTNERRHRSAAIEPRIRAARRKSPHFASNLGRSSE